MPYSLGGNEQFLLFRVENTYELQKQGSSKSGKYGSVLVRLQLIEAQSDFLEVSVQSGGNREYTESSNYQATAAPSDKAKLPGDAPIVFDEAQRSAAKLETVKGMSTFNNIAGTINTDTTIASVNGFALVCGYVETLMKIGDLVSEVNTGMTTTQPSLLMLFQFHVSGTPLGKPCMEYLKCHSKGLSVIKTAVSRLAAFQTESCSRR